MTKVSVPTSGRAARTPGALIDGAITGTRLWSAAVTGASCVTLAALVLTAPAAGASVGAGPVGDGSMVRVIVEGSKPGTESVEAAVRRAGGSVEARLGIINGVRAQVPAAQLDALQEARGVLDVNPDGTLAPLDERWGDDTTGESAKASKEVGKWKADHDQGSAFTIAKEVGARAVWRKSDPNVSGRKLTGHGVGVALIDTGVSPVEGLITPGKLVNGPDLSFESQATNTRYLDGFGHGTHMAGLIAGKDTAVSPGKEADPKNFTGMAPDARLVSVRVGTGDGGVDVSQVIAGIDWVVTNQAKYNIRVLNLSYGTNSDQSYTLDPLAHAVESAWHAGIVVVVAAGNGGESGPLPLTMPAIDPFVIAVGSADHDGSDKPEARRVGAWTNSGTPERRPDLLAPGKSVVSLRVPGSAADRDHPEGLVAGENGRMFRGTGTSQSAAIVSGAAALLLQRDPSLTPDQVKGLLKANADPLEADSSAVQGAGMLDVKGAVEQLETGRKIPAYTQTAARSTGYGALDLARGGSYVIDPDTGAILRGEMDPFGVAWDAVPWAAASTAGTAWTGGTWRGTTWAGTGWTGDTWASTAWTRRSWSDVDWSRRSWSTMSFLRRSWSGDDWTRRSWSAETWTRRSWSTQDAR